VAVVVMSSALSVSNISYLARKTASARRASHSDRGASARDGPRGVRSGAHAPRHVVPARRSTL